MGDLHSLVRKHAANGLLIDTNVLLLLVVGSASLDLIAKVKRTRSYSRRDFGIAKALAKRFRRIIITPHVFAELTNLLPLGSDARVARLFEGLVAVLRGTDEEQVSKDVLLDSEILPRIGATDLSILEVARNGGCLVLSDDLRCVEYLRRARCDVVNLNHIRGQSWFGPSSD